MVMVMIIIIMMVMMIMMMVMIIIVVMMMMKITRILMIMMIIIFLSRHWSRDTSSATIVRRLVVISFVFSKIRYDDRYIVWLVILPSTPADL